ncbi:BPSS1780 family membrane protein [Pseudoduganella sp. OTU4001]|uniref:BPSS1780 family membrane protein n=1 Tax=Pseudoduganella sp. OTU4001 TaxID=3043854 RepID=UPI00313E0CF6
MSKIPASAGPAWIREGFAIFRKQPGGLMLVMLAYLLASVVLGIIPLVGQWLPVVLGPVSTAVFLQACLAADRDQRLTGEVLRPIFQKPVFPRLVGLGALFVLMVSLLALIFAGMVGSDAILQMAVPQAKPEISQALPGSGSALLLVFLLSLPISMAMLFAAPLINWQQMGVGKALFYSFFAVWRALAAFVVYFVCWMVIVMLGMFAVQLVVGRTALGMALSQSLLMVMVMVIQCSVYAAYRTIFGGPGSQDSPVSQESADGA